MVRTTQIVGAILVVIGLGGYTLGEPHWTALLPAFLGAAVLVLGLVATRLTNHRHAIHGALALSLIGAVGGLERGIGLFTGELGAANVSSGLMTVVCVVYLALGIRSFRAARAGQGASA